NYCSTCHPGNWNTYTAGTANGGFTSSGNITVTGGLYKGILRSNSLNVTYSAGVDSAAQANVTSNVGSDVVFTNASNSLGEAAATVEGSTSLQKFSSIYIDVD